MAGYNLSLPQLFLSCNQKNVRIIVKKDIPARLYWSCRRGMLELDVLLGNFLNEAYSDLNEKDQKIFVNLLSENDQDLFMWLTGKNTPTDDNFAEIVAKIREHAKNRH